MAGRPKYEFTDEQIAKAEELALGGCQNGTIATILEVDKETLVKYLSPLLTKKRAERKAELRQKQDKMALTVPAMAIFLGKNELGQEDKRTVKQESTITHDLSPELLALGKKMATQYAKGAK